MNWDPKSYTQFTQNTQNEGSVTKNTNSADCAYSAGREYSLDQTSGTLPKFKVIPKGHMGWRELVNWDPKSYTQFTQNTQNERSVTKNTNSADCAYSAGNIPDYIRPNLEDNDLSELTEVQENLIYSLFEWVDTCKPGDEWQMPFDWLPDSDELRVAAEEVVMQRHPSLRIWRTGKDKLICKAWLGLELPRFRKPPSKRKFRSDVNRIKTMWSKEHGWCRWNPVKQDYV